MKTPVVAAAALAAPLALPALAQDAPAPPKRPKIGIAFAGGGARGGAHVGVLKVLEELRVPVDYVAGTSIGSIVAALYASGMSPDEMDKVLATTDWDDALNDAQGRKDQPYRQKEDDQLYLIKAELGFNHGKLVLPKGLVAGQKLNYLLRRLTLPATDVRDFDRLRIPFRCVATDIVTGGKVVLSKGELPRAVRASMAIPGFFDPVEWDGKLLTDGGTVDNMPVDVVRQMGADVVIAIDISTPLKKRDEITSFLSIAGQTSGFLTRLNVEQQIATLKKDRDVLITPDLEEVSTLDFKQFPKASAQGLKAADAMRETLARFSVSEAEYAAFLKRQRDPRVDPVVQEVRVEAPPGVDPRLLEGRIQSKPGPVQLARPRARPRPPLRARRLRDRRLPHRDRGREEGPRPRRRAEASRPHAPAVRPRSQHGLLEQLVRPAARRLLHPAERPARRAQDEDRGRPAEQRSLRVLPADRFSRAVLRLSDGLVYTPADRPLRRQRKRCAAQDGPAWGGARRRHVLRRGTARSASAPSARRRTTRPKSIRAHPFPGPRRRPPCA